MSLLPLTTDEDFDRIAEALVAHWAERGMTYTKEYASEYLCTEHSLDIVWDKTFVFKNDDDKLVGSIAFVWYEGSVAELRDEITFSPFDRHTSLEQMVRATVKCMHTFSSLRKIYSLTLPHDVEPYRAAGFQEEGFLRDHFKEGEDLTIMSLFLDM